MNDRNNNLFDPRFGKRPLRFVGRDDVLRDIRAALEDPEESERVTILTGVKGSGKSAILAEIRAGLEPYRVVIYDHEEGLPAGPDPGRVYFVDDASRDVPGLGVFIADFTRRVHEGEDLRLILAGLPHAVDELLKYGELSILRRARRIVLGNVRVDEALSLYAEASDNAADGVLLRAATATAGYPYMIQLVGYYLFKDDKPVDDAATDKAIFLAKIELYKNIHDPQVMSLSSKDRMFLWAMAQDEGASEFGEIARRMNVSAGYASKYRERLINAGVIYSSAYGELAFTLPFMKEYIEKEYIERLGGAGGKRR